MKLKKLKIRLAEPDDFSPQALELLRGQFEVLAAPLDAFESLADALASCEVFWFRLGYRIQESDLPADGLKIIACPVTGLDHIDLDACKKRNIQVVSLRGEVDFLKRIRATAEHTFGLLFSLMRNLPAASLHAEQGLWERDLFRGHELFEKTLGLVGVGRLGCIVGEIASAFGMRVIGFDPREDFPSHVARVESLDELCAKSDVVSLHVSYNESTHHLFGETQLEKLGCRGFLVNTSRGGVVNTQALLDALLEKKIAGAALDVVEGEPNFQSTDPLFAFAREHNSLVITPHIGGNTYESFSRTEVFLAHQVFRALNLEEVNA